MGTYTEDEYQDHIARVEWQHPNRETRELMDAYKYSSSQHSDETKDEYKARLDANAAEAQHAARRAKEEYDRLHPEYTGPTKAELEAKKEKEWRDFKRKLRRAQTKRSKEFDELQELNAKKREADKLLTPIKFVRDICYRHIRFRAGDVTAITVGGRGKTESSVLGITMCIPCYVPNDSFVELDRNNLPASYYDVLAKYD